MTWCITIKVIIGFIILLHTTVESTSVACFDARRCIHNYKQKCGINKKGVFQRFWDTCSMKKFNCDNKEDFIMTDIQKCSHIKVFKRNLTQPWEMTLPGGEKRKKIMTTVTRRTIPKKYGKVYWCIQAGSCNKKNCVKTVCGHDRGLKRFSVFNCLCAMANINCQSKTNYTGTNHSIEQCRKYIWEASNLGNYEKMMLQPDSVTIESNTTTITPKVLRFGFNVGLAYIGQIQIKDPQPEYKQETISITETNTDTEKKLDELEQEQFQSESDKDTNQESESDPDQESEFKLGTEYQVPKLMNQTTPSSTSSPLIETEIQSESKESLSELEQQSDIETKKQSIILSEEEDCKVKQRPKNHTDSPSKLYPETEESESEESLTESIKEPEHKPTQIFHQQTDPPFEYPATEPENIQTESKESLSDPEQQSDIESKEQSIILSEEEDLKVKQTLKNHTEAPPKPYTETEGSESEESLTETNIESDYTPTQIFQQQTDPPFEYNPATEPGNIQSESKESLSDTEQQSDIESKEQSIILSEEEDLKVKQTPKNHTESPSKLYSETEESESEESLTEPNIEPEHKPTQIFQQQTDPPFEYNPAIEPENIKSESKESLSDPEQQSDIESKEQSIILSEEADRQVKQTPKNHTEAPSKSYPKLEESESEESLTEPNKEPDYKPTQLFQQQTDPSFEYNPATQPENIQTKYKEFLSELEQKSDIESKLLTEEKHKQTIKNEQKIKLPSESNTPTEPQNIQFESEETLQQSDIESKQQSIVLSEEFEEQLQLVTKSAIKLDKKQEPPFKAQNQLGSKELQSESDTRSRPETQKQSRSKANSNMVLLKQLDLPFDLAKQLEYLKLKSEFNPETHIFQQHSKMEPISAIDFIKHLKSSIKSERQLESSGLQPDPESQDLRSESGKKLDLKKQQGHHFQSKLLSEREPQFNIEFVRQSDIETDRQPNIEFVRQSDIEREQQSEMESIRQSNIEIDQQSVPHLHPVIPEQRRHQERPFHEYYG